MAKKYVVKLKGRERLELERKLRSGRDSARTLARARVLLKCDDGCTDEEVVEAVGVSLGTVERSRKRFCQGGLDAALTTARSRRVRTSGRSTGPPRLVTLACSTAPGGREAWTLQLLADSMVRLNYVGGPVSDETVRRALKKTRSSRG
jgi:transposase